MQIRYPLEFQNQKCYKVFSIECTTWRCLMVRVATPSLVSVFLAIAIAHAYVVTPEDVIKETFVNYAEIKAARYRLRTEKALSEALRAGFNQVTSGVNASTEYGKRGDTSLITPNTEVFIKKEFRGGYSVSGAVGSDFATADSKLRDESRGYTEMRAEVPIFGSEKARDQEIKVLKQESDTMIVHLDFYDASREHLKKAMDAYFAAVSNRSALTHLLWYRE